MNYMDKDENVENNPCKSGIGFPMFAAELSFFFVRLSFHHAGKAIVKQPL